MIGGIQSPNEPEQTKNEEASLKKYKQMRKTIPTSVYLQDSDPKTSL